MAKLSVRSVLILTLWCSTHGGSKAQALSAQNEALSERFITSSHLHKLLREPHGLEKLSAIIGDVSIPSSEERWGEESLVSITPASDVIILGAVTARDSYLVEEGKSIATRYTINPTEVLKGNVIPQQITFEHKGGKVVLANGHTVEVHNLVSDSVATNQTYIFFLRHEGDKLVLTRAARGIAHVSPEQKRVTLVDPEPAHDIELRREIDGVAPDVAAQRIRAASK